MEWWGGGTTPIGCSPSWNWSAEAAGIGGQISESHHPEQTWRGQKTLPCEWVHPPIQPEPVTREIEEGNEV
jgi:hypothetical protein